MNGLRGRWVGAPKGVIDGKHDVKKVCQRVGEVVADKFIADVTPLVGGDNQSTAAQAGQVITYHLGRDVEGDSQLGGITGP